ncbi:MAG: sigma-70 family RNA polymerase sigma factor [Chitinophagaceae bacterium]|nr:sigma-70 family RNA polymerase sigma factor [Chitinophagaceae bacterium]
MASVKQYTDEQIIQHILDGATAQFEVLIRRYNPYLYKIGRSYNYNHQDTEDLMQETFINAFKHLADFEHRSAFKTWLLKIMLNQCFRKRQKYSFKNEQSKEIAENSTPMFTNKQETNNSLTNKELKDVLEHALQSIPLEYRLVFSLREINGLNTAETADTLDITQSNVKARLNRAKAMMRREIEQIYTAEELYEFNLIYCDAMVERVMKQVNKTAATM